MVKQAEKQQCITVTNGRITDLPVGCEQLNIRGSVGFYQDIQVKKISTHGHCAFQFNVSAEQLKSTGQCIVKGSCKINDVQSAGNLKLNKGDVSRLTSSGRIIIEQMLQADHAHILGIILANGVEANHFHLTLSGKSKIDELTGDTIIVKQERKTISFLKKSLECKKMKAKTIHICNTSAKIVDGHIVTVGKNCSIDTLYYKESYSISPLSKVKKIIKRSPDE